MGEYVKYPEEVKKEMIIKTVIRYKFYCPHCGRRIRLNGVRMYNDSCGYFQFRPCPCGYETEPKVVG